MCEPTKSLLNVLMVMVLNVATDIYLLSIPLPVNFDLWIFKEEKRLLTLPSSFGRSISVCVARFR